MKFMMNLSWVDAIFYTVVTLSTLGVEAPPLSPAGKIFISLLLICGLGTMGYAGGKLANEALTEHLMAAMGKRRDRRATRMEGHWILCGLGRVGEHVAEQFDHDGLSFCAIEADPLRVEAGRTRGWIILTGDAKDEDTLKAAGIERAVGILVTLSGDADNVYVVLTARSIRKDLRIVARAGEAHSVPILYRAGADRAINLVTAGASAIARAATKPTVAAFFDADHMRQRLGADFQSIRIASDSSLCGLPLAESGLRQRFNALAVGLVRGPEVRYNPLGSEILRAGDELFVLVPTANVRELQAVAAGTTTPPS
jgi:voltage-gated potassium channel